MGDRGDVQICYKMKNQYSKEDSDLRLRQYIIMYCYGSKSKSLLEFYFSSRYYSLTLNYKETHLSQ